MIEVIPARPEMANFIDLQTIQSISGQSPTPEIIAHAITRGPAFAFVKDDLILGLGGLAEQWEDRAVVWGLLSCSIGATFTVMHRTVVRALDVSAWKRVEAQVLSTHREGHRWIKLLGFEQEGVMKSYWQGQDFTLYSRVKG